MQGKGREKERGGQEYLPVEENESLFKVGGGISHYGPPRKKKRRGNLSTTKGRKIDSTKGGVDRGGEEGFRKKGTSTYQRNDEAQNLQKTGQRSKGGKKVSKNEVKKRSCRKKKIAA